MHGFATQVLYAVEQIIKPLICRTLSRASTRVNSSHYRSAPRPIEVFESNPELLDYRIQHVEATIEDVESPIDNAERFVVGTASLASA